MGNLVLSRQEGQSVRLTQPFWAPIYVEVGRITGGGVDILLVKEGAETYFHAVALMTTLQVAPGAVMTVAAIAKGRVKLSFNAPLTVTIMRTELEIGCDE